MLARRMDVLYLSLSLSLSLSLLIEQKQGCYNAECYSGVAIYIFVVAIYFRGWYFGSAITPVTKLGKLGSELVYNCVLKSKTGVQVYGNI